MLPPLRCPADAAFDIWLPMPPLPQVVYAGAVPAGACVSMYVLYSKSNSTDTKPLRPIYGLP